MTAATLKAKLEAAGLNVREYPGWETRGGSWTGGSPVGIMHHHTARPVPYPLSNLAGEGTGLIKCNINTKPDGTVWLVAFKACNYSSGMGSGTVLAEVIAGKPPTANASTRKLADTTGGNTRFWNFENDHEGDGRPLPTAQRKAIITASIVVADYLGVTHRNTISHAEWTARKKDPFWDGSLRAIEAIREGMATGIVTPPPPPPPPPPPATDWTKELINVLPTLRENDGWKTNTHLRNHVRKAQALLAVEGHIAPNTFDEDHRPDGLFGPGTKAAVFGFQTARQLSRDGIIGPETWTALLK